MRSNSGDFDSIIDLVVSYVIDKDGHVEYSKLEKTVKEEFKTAFDIKHWRIYKGRIIRGDYDDKFKIPMRVKRNLDASQFDVEISTDAISRRSSPSQKHFVASSSPQDDIIDLDQKILDGLTKNITEVAVSYHRLTKRSLHDITGELGELLVCKQFGLKLAKQGSRGYDAIDSNGKQVQIKSRRSNSDSELPKLSGRISKISEHPFDYALIAILDKEYNLREVYKILYKALIRLVAEEQTNDSGPSLSSCIRIADQIYP